MASKKTTSESVQGAVLVNAQVVKPDPLGRSSGFFTDSKTFMGTNYQLHWLVTGLLVRGQPCLLGGPIKVLKTTLLIDMGVSMAAGGNVFGHFSVEKPLRVGVLNGESGEATIQETVKRICRAKGIANPESLNVFWGFRLPQLSNPEDLTRLKHSLRNEGIDVVILDPLYLSLLAGNTDLQASNLYHMGPLLMNVTQACLETGATPIFAHHTKKLSQPAYQPIELDDLAFSGVQEFARQWILVSRRGPFDPDTGLHRLWLGTGGSVGHAGLYALDVEEGRLADNFSGRKWEITVRSAKVEIRAAVKRRAEKKT